MTQLETMKEFVLNLKKELKEERTMNGNKFKMVNTKTSMNTGTDLMS